MGNGDLTPRDAIKLAFQYQETEQTPYCFGVNDQQAEGLTRLYGGAAWQDRVVTYIGSLAGVDNFLWHAGIDELPDGTQREVDAAHGGHGACATAEDARQTPGLDNRLSCRWFRRRHGRRFYAA